MGGRDMSDRASEMPGDDFEADTSRKEHRIRRELLPKLRLALGRVPFAEDVLAAYYAILDRRTPTHVRATLVGALAYFVLPFDIVPDFIAGLGFTDDAAVLIAALRMVGGAIEPRHREAAARWLAEAGGGGNDKNPRDDQDGRDDQNRRG
jgi:uncharacterized membrane protein YkvA (DUF1232 family)